MEDLAKISAGTGSAERVTRKRKTKENEVGGYEREDNGHQWVGGLGQENGDDDGQHGG